MEKSPILPTDVYILKQQSKNTAENADSDFGNAEHIRLSETNCGGVEKRLPKALLHSATVIERINNASE